MHDIVIRGGTIIDGTGAAAFIGDIAVDGGKIVTDETKRRGFLPRHRVLEIRGLCARCRDA